MDTVKEEVLSGFGYWDLQYIVKAISGLSSQIHQTLWMVYHKDKLMRKWTVSDILTSRLWNAILEF